MQTIFVANKGAVNEVLFVRILLLLLFARIKPSKLKDNYVKIMA